MAVNVSDQAASVLRVHGVRYQTRDVSRAVALYTQLLGFALKHQQGEAFAAVRCGDLDVLLSGNLGAVVETLRARGVRFRSDVISGPGGKQIQLLDPDDNPIELFEPAQRS